MCACMILCSILNSYSLLGTGEQPKKAPAGIQLCPRGLGDGLRTFLCTVSDVNPAASARWENVAGSGPGRPWTGKPTISVFYFKFTIYRGLCQNGYTAAAADKSQTNLRQILDKP